MQQRHEQRRADDRPHDRKRLAAHVEHEGLGQVELVRDPRTEEGVTGSTWPPPQPAIVRAKIRDAIGPILRRYGN